MFYVERLLLCHTKKNGLALPRLWWEIGRASEKVHKILYWEIKDQRNSKVQKNASASQLNVFTSKSMRPLRVTKLYRDTVVSQCADFMTPWLVSSATLQKPFRAPPIDIKTMQLPGPESHCFLCVAPFYTASLNLTMSGSDSKNAHQSIISIKMKILKRF